MTKGIKFIPLDKDLDRNSFDCGSNSLNNYLKNFLSQDIKKNYAKCYVALINDKIAGYYTLSAHSILLEEVPVELQKKLPKYPNIPCVRMGRLAVDKNFQKQGIGTLLLIDALKNIVLAPIGIYALIVDAKEDAVSFYEYFGFERFPKTPNKLFIKLDKAKKAYSL